MVANKVCQHRRLTNLAAAAMVAAALTGSAAVSQPVTPPGGKLKCDVEGGLSYIIGSSRALDCVYMPDGFPPEYYKGSINKIGIDIGFQRAGVIVWAVLSPGLTRGPGALTGNYVGISADVAAGLGAGADALIGGNKVVLRRSASAAISASTRCRDRRSCADLCRWTSAGAPQIRAVHPAVEQNIAQ